jgi:hypothetical protein
MAIDTRRCAAALILAALINGCAESPQDYLPFTEGKSWQYSVTRTGSSGPTVGQTTVRVEALVEMDGQSVAIFTQPPYSRNYYTVEQDGVRRVATARGMDGVVTADVDRHYLLRYPGRSPDHWTLASTLALIEEKIDEGVRFRDQGIPLTMTFRVASSDEEVTVPAGRYPHCLRIDGAGTALVPVHKGETTARVDVASSDWYAPGVGLVKSVRTETSPSSFLVPGTFTQELTAVR